MKKEYFSNPSKIGTKSIISTKNQFLFENCFNSGPSIARPAVNNATWKICADVQFGEIGNEDLKIEICEHKVIYEKKV